LAPRLLGPMSDLTVAVMINGEPCIRNYAQQRLIHDMGSSTLEPVKAGHTATNVDNP